jgi:hypothetical protein
VDFVTDQAPEVGSVTDLGLGAQYLDSVDLVVDSARHPASLLSRYRLLPVRPEGS